MECQRPSPRQLEILALAANGLSREEISRQLHISPMTVRCHMDNARERMAGVNITHTIVLCVTHGFLGVDGRSRQVYVPEPIEIISAIAA